MNTFYFSNPCSFSLSHFSQPYQLFLSFIFSKKNSLTLLVQLKSFTYLKKKMIKSPKTKI